MQPNQTPPPPPPDPSQSTPPSLAPPPPPPSYGQAPPQYIAQPKSNGLAIASLVLGIVGMTTAWMLIGFLLALIGLILGIVSLANKKPGRGLAIGGVVTSALTLVAGALVVMFFITAFQSTSQVSSSLASRSEASLVAKKAEAYNAVMGSAEKSHYPDYQTLTTQTEVVEAQIDEATLENLYDGSQHHASEETPIIYQGCDDGAMISYWDISTKQVKSISAGEPSQCSFGHHT